MVAVRFLLFEHGDAEFEEDHPICKSPFVESVVEVAAKTDGFTSIQLPEFIRWDPFIEFANFLFDNCAGDHTLTFGKYHGDTYQHVYNVHCDYYQWAANLSDPSPQMQAFLDWCEFVRNGSKLRGDQDVVSQVLRIAKYFQVDMCGRCTRLGGDHVLLQPCRRTKWPNIPTIPDYDTVTGPISGSEAKSRAWREAWKLADKERGRSVCVQDEEVCTDCSRQVGCSMCKEWECEDCQGDKESPKIFEQWHEDIPDGNEDDYGRRGEPPYRALEARRCLGPCGRRVCDDCGKECYECNRRACGWCTEDLNSWCEACRSTILNNDDSAIGPIDRDEYLCRSCFDRRPHFCGCGEPSYDPKKAEEEGTDSEEEGPDSAEDENDYSE